MTNSTEFEAVDVDIDDWITGTSFLQAKHTIYRNPAMFAEYQPLLDRIDVLEQEIAALEAPDEDDVVEERTLDGEASLTAAPTTDRALGEKAPESPRLAELRAELKRLTVKANEMYELYSADVEVWRLRKLERPEAAAIVAALGEPPMEPVPPARDAKPQAHAAYRRKFDAAAREAAAFTTRSNLHCIAAATMSVTVGGVDRGGVTAEQMERLLARPGGEQHVLELIAVVEQLSIEGVDIVAPHRSGA